MHIARSLKPTDFLDLTSHPDTTLRRPTRSRSFELILGTVNESALGPHRILDERKAEGPHINARAETVGQAGDIVEFNPNAHRTVDGSIPSEPRVRVVRPMVVRNRADGSEEVVERAIVAESD